MTRLGNAIALAAETHKDQRDKGGEAYILHPLAVMQRATDYYLARSDGYKLEDVQIVAVLHDALEDLIPDEGWERHRLSNRIYQEFGSEAHAAVDALTKYPRQGSYEETYDEYLQRVAKNWMARIVKIADLSHNLDAFRLPKGKITERDFERWDKYHRALVFLTKVEKDAR
jgi:(p)ppGpp synthase/HD superfamily hydrolase